MQKVYKYVIKIILIIVLIKILRVIMVFLLVFLSKAILNSLDLIQRLIYSIPRKTYTIITKLTDRWFQSSPLGNIKRFK